jgi:predicted ATPase/DNA-binding SARP family transcriptional activator
MAGLSLAVLGPLQVTLHGTPVTVFESDKVRALLAYLAVEADRPHRRDALAGLLWPDRTERGAHLNLNQALANLRGAIGDRTATPSFLSITREAIQFNRASDYELDVEAFIARLAASDQHPHRHLETCKSCVQRLRQAADLYRSSFLAQFFLSDSAAFEEWALLKREWLHRRALHALVHLADYHERRGEYEQAQHDIWRQLELDGWREESHRQLMRVLALSGQRSAALEQYKRCRRILADELGVEPEEETTALYERIRDTASAELSVQRDETQYLRNFPAQTTALIGRKDELKELGALLENPVCRLITIVGPGGIGKTRLALAAAADQAEAFMHGAAFVPLQATSSAAFLVPAILSALDIRLQGQRDPRDQLLNYLRGKELLLVLDNIEQLLTPDQTENDGTAELLSAILACASGVTLLITSRERLNLQGEWIFDILGLQVPAANQTERVEDYSAVALFLQRARKVHTRFTFGVAEKRAVARICWLVEGMPLAVELAAAWVRALSCVEIAHEIERSLGFLTTSMRDVPERQRSLAAVFDHSWRLLSADERCVFRKLSVFRGGFQRDAAVQVAGASLPLLAALVDKSLLRRNAAGRYELHELVRQFAGEKLEQVGEAGGTMDQHATYFLALAELADSHLYDSSQKAWLDRLEMEHDNCRAALAWSHKADDAESGLRLAGALGRFWYVRGYFSEGRHWLEEGLAQGGAQAIVRAKALSWAAELAGDQADNTIARALIQASIELYREAGDKRGLAMALTHFVWFIFDKDNDRLAQSYLEESVLLFRAVGDQWGLAWALYTHAFLSDRQGDELAARASAEESLALYRAFGDEWNLAGPLSVLGNLALRRGDFAGARDYYKKGLDLWCETGDQVGIASGQRRLGILARVQGDYPRAATLLAESLATEQELGRMPECAQCLVELAKVAAEQGQLVRAARLFGATDLVQEANGAEIFLLDRPSYDHNVRTHLDEATFAAAWAEGRTMTLEQAIAYALEGSHDDAVSSIAATIGLQ